MLLVAGEERRPVVHVLHEVPHGLGAAGASSCTRPRAWLGSSILRSFCARGVPAGEETERHRRGDGAARARDTRPRDARHHVARRVEAGDQLAVDPRAPARRRSPARRPSCRWRRGGPERVERRLLERAQVGVRLVVGIAVEVVVERSAPRRKSRSTPFAREAVEALPRWCASPRASTPILPASSSSVSALRRASPAPAGPACSVISAYLSR